MENGRGRAYRFVRQVEVAIAEENGTGEGAVGETVGSLI